MRAKKAKQEFEIIAKWDPCEAFPAGYSGPLGIVSSSVKSLARECERIMAAAEPLEFNLIARPDVIWVVDTVRGEIYWS